MNFDDCELMGINRKLAIKWMILTVLPIPPVCVRPSITRFWNPERDDLTHKLVDVIRINQRLKGTSSPCHRLIVEDLWELLQYHITTYFNNEVAEFLQDTDLVVHCGL